MEEISFFMMPLKKELLSKLLPQQNKKSAQASLFMKKEGMLQIFLSHYIPECSGTELFGLFSSTAYEHYSAIISFTILNSTNALNQKTTHDPRCRPVSLRHQRRS